MPPDTPPQKYHQKRNPNNINDSNVDIGFGFDNSFNDEEPKTDRDFYGLSTDRKLINMGDNNQLKNSHKQQPSTMAGSSNKNQMAFLDDNIDSDTSRIGKSSIY